MIAVMEATASRDIFGWPCPGRKSILAQASK
jgi:hypothetical protein